MEVFQVIIVATISFVVLFILTKISGTKELSEATMFDYIMGITIGSIAAEMTMNPEKAIGGIAGMIVYTAISLILAIGTNKSQKFRRIIYGNSYILLDNGKLYRENFKKCRMDLNEFLMKCRIKGYYNIADIQTVILETNGNISIIPKELKRPATPEDLNLNPSQETLIYSIILDGKIIPENLKYSGKDINWLNKEIKKQGYTKTEDIFLATFDKDNNLTIYPKLSKKINHDVFK